MKRSEMIAIIKETIEKYFDLYDNQFIKQGSERILDEMKKAGMLPPPRLITGSGSERVYAELSWEPEDEKK